MNSGGLNEIQVVGPLRPVRTGIAGYVEDFLAALDGRWPIRLVKEPGSRIPSFTNTTSATMRELSQDLPLISHVGNSELHPHAFAAAREIGGVVVLHDAILAHARFVEAVHTGKTRQLQHEAEQLYGEAGLEAVERLRRGLRVEDLERFPFIETVIERAQAVVVHNSFAANLVEAACREAEVIQIPMGVPLPATIDKQVARQILGIPSSAYVIASITHINPFKRLDVILRAMRRLVPRVPEALLLVAGSPSEEVPVDQIAWTLGVERQVKSLGYVTDDEARLLAQAADVCVNLRYPSLGETSASLLRLLGAGRPVIVTEGPMSRDLPGDVGIPIPPGRLEVDMLVESLELFANETALLEETGKASRRFIEEQHNMRVAVRAYADILHQTYDLELAATEPPNLHEGPMDVAGYDTPHVSSEFQGRRWWAGRKSAEALADFGLDSDDQLLASVAARHVELGIDRTIDLGEPAYEGVVDAKLLRSVCCPNCEVDLNRSSGEVYCPACEFTGSAGERAIDLRLPNG